MKSSVLLLLCVLGAPAAFADAEGRDCYRRVGLELPTDDPPPGWHFPPINAAAAALEGYIPIVTRGDFDGDKKRDVAFLIETDTAKERMLAVCLSSIKDVQYVRDVGCTLAITLGQKEGQNVIDGDCQDDKTREYFVFKKGRFQRIDATNLDGMP